MNNNKANRNKVMAVRYKPEEVNRLKNKATGLGLDVSTYVRYVSLNSLKNG